MIVHYTTRVSDSGTEMIFSWKADGVATVTLEVDLTGTNEEYLDSFIYGLLTDRARGDVNNTVDTTISKWMKSKGLT